MDFRFPPQITWLLCTLAALFVSACAAPQHFDATVTHFLNDRADISNKSFIINYTDEQQKSLISQRYGHSIATQFEQKGLTAVNAEPADLLVSFTTHTRDAKTLHYQAPRNLGVGIGYGYGIPSWSIGGMWNDPFHSNNSRSYAEHRYTHEFSMRIQQGKSNTTSPLFEGRATTISDKADFHIAGRCLIESFFIHFPAEDGLSLQINLPYEQCNTSQQPR